MEVAKHENPCHRWGGAKIPLELVRQITSFFEWSFKETNSETVVHLFYNEDTEAWKAAVLPQKGYTGMSVTMLPDHPGTTQAIEALGPGFCECGTWHHHCKASAFQSGADNHDEAGRESGLHVTIGDIGTARYSLHARCKTHLGGNFTDAVLSDWVGFSVNYDLPPGLPEELVSPIIEHLICQPDAAVDFPEAWKENVIKVQPVYQQHQGNLYNWQPHWKSEPDNHKRIKPLDDPRVYAGHDLDQLAWVWQVEKKELALAVQKYQEDDLLLDIAEVMVEHRLEFQDVIAMLQGKGDADEETPKGNLYTAEDRDW